MAKKWRSRRRKSDGFNYFQNLPDELVICIFTKLSNNNNDEHDSHADLKALVPCLSVSRRFSELVCHVPTSLSINYPSIAMLYKYCPNILRKFKNIRSLKVTHTELQTKGLPIIFWEATYRPHSYCLVVVSDIDQDPQSLMLPNDTAKDDKYYYKSLWSHIKNMFRLHHMLVSSIKDLRHLQRVVVTDAYNWGTLIIEDHTLAALRNCTSTNLEHVLVHQNSGLNLKGVCFSIIEWHEKANHNRSHEDEVVTGVPADLPDRSRLTKKVLRHLLENPANVEVNDSKEILELLSNIKSDGNLL